VSNIRMEQTVEPLSELATLDMKQK